MSKQLTITKPVMPALDAVEGWEDALLEYNEDGFRLIPLDKLDPIECQLYEATNARTSPEYADELTKILIAGYSEKQHPKNLEPIMLGLVDELQEFPPDIARDGVREVRRTVTFFPAIAEVCQACDELMERRQRMFDVAAMMINEHEKRHERKRRDEEAAAQREVWLAEQEKIKAKEEKQKAKEEKVRAEEERVRVEEEEKQRQQRRQEFKDQTQEVLTGIEQDAIQHFGDAIKPGMLWKIVQCLVISCCEYEDGNGLVPFEWDEDRLTREAKDVWKQLVLVSQGDPWAFEIYKHGAIKIASANGSFDPRELVNEGWSSGYQEEFEKLPLDLRKDRYPEEQAYMFWWCE